jgi:hypothetical protein
LSISPPACSMASYFLVKLSGKENNFAAAASRDKGCERRRWS